jgi:hypothetical protein
MARQDAVVGARRPRRGQAPAQVKRDAESARNRRRWLLEQQAIEAWFAGDDDETLDERIERVQRELEAAEGQAEVEDLCAMRWDF